MDPSLWEQAASVPAPGRSAPVRQMLPFWSRVTGGEKRPPLAGRGRARSALSWRRASFLLDGSTQASASWPSFHFLGPFSTFRLSSPSITALGGNGALTPSSLPACQAMVSSRGWKWQNPGCQLSWALPTGGDRNKQDRGVVEGGEAQGGGPLGRESALGGGHGTAQATKGGPSCVAQGLTSDGGL